MNFSTFFFRYLNTKYHILIVSEVILSRKYRYFKAVDSGYTGSSGKENILIQLKNIDVFILSEKFGGYGKHTHLGDLANF